MTEASFVGEALGSSYQVQAINGHIAVPTHCLYPSNGAVTVYVTGGPSGSRVSDEGGAIDLLSSHDREVADPDRYLHRFCKVRGLKSENGKIYSPIVPLEGLSSAVAFVANASAAAAHWGVEHLRAKPKRDLRKELREILVQTFSFSRVEDEGHLVGKSNRHYRFDYLVRYGDSQFIVIDAVLRDANSINSHTVSHLDVSNLGDPKITQRMVYDDQERWDAADLNLLQMAATLVPFSGAVRSFYALRHSWIN